MKPQRIQRKRTKGWKMPANTVYVGRLSKWGNPYKQDKYLNPIGAYSLNFIAIIGKEAIKRKLKGKNLACWCPLDQPCHADVLLEIANT